LPRLLSAGRDADRAKLDRVKSDRVKLDRIYLDRVYLENGDELTGTILAIGDKTVDLDAAVGKVAVERAKIAGIAFNPSLVAAAGAKGPRVLTGFRDGSRLVAPARRGEVVELTLFGGLKRSVARRWSVQPLAASHASLNHRAIAIPFLTRAGPTARTRTWRARSFARAAICSPRGSACTARRGSLIA
jgi:hypothetical protein